MLMISIILAISGCDTSIHVASSFGPSQIVHVTLNTINDVHHFGDYCHVLFYSTLNWNNCV